MSNRDEFPDKTKKAVAARAGWHCSFTGCPKLTVGPSEESSDAITNIGEAARQITGAALSRTPEKGYYVCIKNDSIYCRPEILRRARGEELAEACYKKAIERGQTARAFRFAKWWTAISNRANEIAMASVATFRN